LFSHALNVVEGDVLLTSDHLEGKPTTPDLFPQTGSG
jgi:hypothetical protein